MQRRSFLGALIGGVAAGPAAVESMRTGLVAQPAPAYGYDLMSQGVALNQSSRAFAPRLEQIARVLKDPDLMALMRQRAAQRVSRWPEVLDPDLAANRSMSLSAKVRLQRERSIDRELQGMLSTEGKSIWDTLLEKGIDL